MTGSDLIYCCDELFQEAFLQPIQSLRVAALGALVALVPVSLCVKFLCQRKSSLTRLQQTRYDRVQGRANRAPIEQLQQDPIILSGRKEGRSTSHYLPEQTRRTMSPQEDPQSAVSSFRLSNDYCSRWKRFPTSGSGTGEAKEDS